eukprot:15346049-Ditylum_brightwellii.AAC.1
MAIDKLKWPLSTYNFFFPYECENVFMAVAAAEGFDPLEVLKELQITASVTGKRRHCCLSKFKWNGLNATAKAPFEAMAMEEKKLYKASVKGMEEKDDREASI